MEKKTKEYLEEKAGSKCFYGGLKDLVGSWIVPFNPVMGFGLIANGVKDVSEGIKMGDLAKGENCS